MWEEGEWTRDMMAQQENNNRMAAEERCRQENEANWERARQVSEETAKKWRQEEEKRNSSQYYSPRSNNSYQSRNENTFTYTTTVASSPLDKLNTFLVIISTIAVTVIFYQFLGSKFGLLGRMGALIGGPLIGGFLFGTLSFMIGRKLLVIVLAVLPILGGGLYMAMPYVVPVVSSITGKALPLSKNTTVTADVNFRAEPSTEGAIIKTIQKGAAVTPTGEVSDGWMQVKYASDTGWVSSEYVKSGRRK